MMATQACNLSCHGCTNYSDLTHKGWVPWTQARQEISAWLHRVDIPDFGILGGEPLMHPQIRQWIRGVRELLPHAQIRFTTNGILLHRNLDIVDLAAEVGNIVFKIGVHVQDARLEKTIQHILHRFDWRPVTEHGVERLTTSNAFRFHVRRPDTFWKTYRGEYHDMMPHDSDPAAAFAICCQQTCPLLYQGRLYKCSTSGLLSDVLDRFQRPNAESWEPLLVPGLAADCADQDLKTFIGNFGKPHGVCRQCPTQQDLESRIDHLSNVSTKKHVKMIVR